MTTFFNHEDALLKGHDFTPSTTGDALQGKKYVLVYFSAHWCPPCRAFTPQLRHFYETHHEKKNMEVVFVSLDTSEKDLQAYMRGYHGNWLSVPYAGVQELAKAWQKAYDFQGIPTVLLFEHNEVDDSYRLITKKAREMITRDPEAEGFPWRNAEAELAAYYKDLNIKILITVALGFFVSFLLFKYTL